MNIISKTTKVLLYQTLVQSIIRNCKAGLVLSITHILKAALSKFRVYVCVLLPNH